MNPEAHYTTTGPEIWEDSEGKVTHFVCGMGTGGTVSGVGRFLKEKNPEIKIIGVDPIGSLYYEFAKTGKIGKARTYVVEGIGEDIFPSTMDFKVLDDVVQVTDRECFLVARTLVKNEGPFTGGSGGGCVSAALRLARTLPAGNFVVAFLPDTGMRYLSKVYSDEWMRERGYLESEVPLTAEDVVAAKHATPKLASSFSWARIRPCSTPCAPCRSRTSRNCPFSRKAALSARFTKIRFSTSRCRARTCASWSSAKS